MVDGPVAPRFFGPSNSSRRYAVSFTRKTRSEAETHVGDRIGTTITSGASEASRQSLGFAGGRKAAEGDGDGITAA